MNLRSERRFYEAIESFLRRTKDCKPRWGTRGTRQEVRLRETGVERQVDVVGLAIRRAPQITPVLVFDHHAVEVKDRIEDMATLKDLIGSIEVLDAAPKRSSYPQHALYLYVAVPETPENRFHAQLMDYCKDQRIGYLEVSPKRYVATEVPWGDRRPNPFISISNRDQQSVGHFVDGINKNPSLSAFVPDSEQLWRDTIERWKRQYGDERLWENSIACVRDDNVQKVLRRLLDICAERGAVSRSPLGFGEGNWEFSLPEGRRVAIRPTRSYVNVDAFGRSPDDVLPGGLTGDILFRIHLQDRVEIVVNNRTTGTPMNYSRFLREMERWIAQ